MSVAYGGSYQSGSLGSNPTVAPIDLTVHGSDFLWAVFAIMLATGLGVTAWTLSRPVGQRAFHAMGAMVLFTATIAYFSMASDLGATPIAVEFVRRKSDLYSGPEDVVYRSIWYARYIDWTITTPLLLSTGMPTSDIVLTVFFDVVMIVTGLIGALVSSQYKWGFYVFGCIAMLVVFYQLIFAARRAAFAIGDDVGKAYITSAGLLSFLWFLYPIAWGLADGGNVISTDSEMVFYGILDVLAKPGYVLLHLFALRNIDYSRFALSSGHYSTGMGAQYTEKQGLMNGHQTANTTHGHAAPQLAPPHTTPAATATPVATTTPATTV